MTGRILVTGASGFVGQPLVRALASSGQRVRAAARGLKEVFPATVEMVSLPDLMQSIEWCALLDGVEIVVHLAGLAHEQRGSSEDIYDRVNRAAGPPSLPHRPRRRASDALCLCPLFWAQCGPAADRILTEAELPRPVDAYGRSKLAAEAAVRASGVDFTILRPVIIYGPRAKGNLASLMRVAASPWPLPFGSVMSRRSSLGIDNLIAAIQLAMNSPTT